MCQKKNSDLFGFGRSGLNMAPHVRCDICVFEPVKVKCWCRCWYRFILTAIAVAPAT